MISNVEAHERYYKASKEAESELQCYIHALTSAADVMDSFETLVLWRMYLEGNDVTEMTFARMIEATN